MKYILKCFCVLAISLFCLLLNSQASFADLNSCNKTEILDDWVSCTKSNSLCHGYYLEPPPPFPALLPNNSEGQPVTITSDQGEFVPDGSSTFAGHIHLLQGNRQVYADRATIHRDAQKKEIDTILLEGNIKLTEPGFRLDGTRAELNLEKDTQLIENTSYRLYQSHARGTADSIFIRDHKRLTLREATYTTCAPLQNTWQLKASKINLNKTTGRGQATHARLCVFDIPIFYSPFLDFPIDDRRKTGFLYPTYGYTKNSGLEFGIPFYWNMAPNYDSTFTPRYLSMRGTEMQGLFRYMQSCNIGDINASILPHDKAYIKFKNENLQNLQNLQNLNLQNPQNLQDLKDLQNLRDQALKKFPFLAVDPRVRALNKTTTRSSFRMTNTSHFNRNLTMNILYQHVGDDNYFVDFGNSIGMASTTQLLQQGELIFQNANWNAQARLQKYQTLHPFTGPATIEPYFRLPQFCLSTNYYNLPGGFNFSASGDFTHFSHKLDKVDYFYRTPYTAPDGKVFNFHKPFAYTTGQRLQYRPGITYPIETPGWFIKPRLQVNFLKYDLKLGPQDISNNLPSHPGMILPMFDLDTGLFFERSSCIGQTSYIQTLEPRAYYLYVPYHNQNEFPNFDSGNGGFDYNQLFRDNRFSGLDRVGDANQVTLAATTRFLAERTGAERVTLTVGQIYYFSKRRVTAANALLDPKIIDLEMPTRRDRISPFAGALTVRLLDELSVGARLEWNPYKTHSNKKTWEACIQPNPYSLINIRYEYLRHGPVILDPRTRLPENTRIDQIDTSLTWQLTEKWRILGRWHYDFYNHRSDDFLLGIEQEGCCTAVRLAVKRFIEPNDPTIPIDKVIPGFKKYSTGIYLQFVFKGFGGVGGGFGGGAHGNIDYAIQHAIPRYKKREKRF